MPMNAEEMLKVITANLPAKTGKTLEEWAAIFRKEGPTDPRLQVKWFKQTYGIGGMTAGIIISNAQGKTSAFERYEDPVALLDAQYAGAKAALRPIYEAIVATARSFGSDVGIVVAQSQVTLRRSRQFAIVWPKTRTRVDLGLSLPGMKEGGRLEIVKSANDADRVRLKVGLEALSDFDVEVKSLLRRAYDGDALGLSAPDASKLVKK